MKPVLNFRYAPNFLATLRRVHLTRIRAFFAIFLSLALITLPTWGQNVDEVIEQFLSKTNTTFIREFAIEYTKQPHLAGTMESFLVANYTYTKARSNRIHEKSGAHWRY